MRYQRRRSIVRSVSRWHTDLRKMLGLRHSESELEPRVVERELLFNAPPLTPQLTSAIRRISPQFRLQSGDPRSRRFWELNQNGVCWGEFEAIGSFLSSLRPNRVLDIGPGLGRSAVFFKKKMNWMDVPFDLYEGAGTTTRYTRAGPRFKDSFCGDFAALQTVLEFNEVGAVEVFDAKRLDAKLSNLPGTYDFVYSFFAVGFHWSIGHFLDELLALMGDRAIGAFTLHDTFDRFEELGDVPHRVAEFLGSWPRDRWSRILLIAKDSSMLQMA